DRGGGAKAGCLQEGPSHRHRPGRGVRRARRDQPPPGAAAPEALRRRRADLRHQRGSGQALGHAARRSGGLKAMLSFEFSDEQKALRETARRYATEVIRPVAAKYDASSEFPREEIKK